MFRQTVLGALIAAMAVPAMAVPAMAQDTIVMEAYPPHIEARIAQQNSALRLDLISLPDEYFISTVKLWDTRQPINVCFFGGSQPLRAAIAKAASGWVVEGTNIPLDFGDVSNPRFCSPTIFSHIRVGFGYQGYWSAVGQDSIALVPQNEQSMNFQLFDIVPPAEPEFTQTVLHEFGHALGFQHEHQSYLAPCETEFNWEAIYTYLAGPPNYWTRERTDHNLRPRPASSGDAGSYDVGSIEQYPFPAEFFLRGEASPCFTKGNVTLSAGDIEGVRKYYPASPAAVEAIRAETLANFQLGVDALPISAAERNLIKLQASTMLQPDSVEGLAFQQFRTQDFGGFDAFERPDLRGPMYWQNGGMVAN